MQPAEAASRTSNPHRSRPTNGDPQRSQDLAKDDELDVCAAQGEGHECSVQAAEITVDSAADESICPQVWVQQFGMEPSRKNLRLVNASGGAITHCGARQVAFQPEAVGRVLGVGFEVTDVKKPLLTL